MEIVFIRHGHAEDVGPDGTDFGRRLVPQGEQTVAATAEAIKAAGYGPDRIICSPRVRAKQTAAIAAQVLTPGSEPEVDERLSGGAGMGDLQGIVEDRPGEVLVLVGHEPDFGGLVSRLIGGGSVAMKKSGAACVRLVVVEPGLGELQWLIHSGIVPGG